MPEDAPEAIVFFASSRASKATDAMLAADGGVPAAFAR